MSRPASFCFELELPLSSYRMELNVALSDASSGNRLKPSGVLQCDPKTVRKYLGLGGN